MRSLLSAALVVVVAISCSHRSNLGNVPVGWQNLDLQRDGVFGISTDKAYAELLRNKKPATVVVAVIDSGIDTLQEDLRPVLWTDPADGSHGRNFVGPETRKEDFIPMLATTTDTLVYRRTLDDYHVHVSRLEDFMGQLRASKQILAQIVRHVGKETPSFDELSHYQPRSDDERRILDQVLERLPSYPDLARLAYSEVDHLLDLGSYHLAHGLNRTMSAADTNGATHRGGVNADVTNDALGLTPDPSGAAHGTMMAGIIGAVRNNGKGIDGINDHVRIMTIKLFGNIREMRNDDLAPAIRWAVGHGARIISMSFGKTFSWHRSAVDSAVRYALSKGVLLVHSAGNNGMDLDGGGNAFFPSPDYLDGGVAGAWMTVGASGYLDDSTLAAPFSNYGHRSMDVFAPGVQISSTLPHGGPASWDGTSEATPVVAGLAALVFSYYPQLTALQVKDIIMHSVVKRATLTNKCVSGGVVNAYDALRLAASYK